MTDRLFTAQGVNLNVVMRELTWPVDTWMWLERLPLTFLDEAARQDGLRLAAYDPQVRFSDWGRGRVFSASGELRWEQQDGRTDAVLCGEMSAPSGFSPATELDLAAPGTKLVERAYYLWGKRVQDTDLQRLGLPSNPVAFIELQIPRVLYYPIAAAQRVRLKVCEYQARDGALVYARFSVLEAA